MYHAPRINPLAAHAAAQGIALKLPKEYQNSPEKPFVPGKPMVGHLLKGGKKRPKTGALFVGNPSINQVFSGECGSVVHPFLLGKECPCLPPPG